MKSQLRPGPCPNPVGVQSARFTKPYESVLFYEKPQEFARGFFFYNLSDYFRNWS
jgi:hypothetical protein